MRPIRIEQAGSVVRNPWTGEVRPVTSSETTHALSRSGLLRSCRVDQQVGCGCGCVAAVGGFCSVCNTTVCVSCTAQGRCPVCMRLACPAHLKLFSAPTMRVETRLCPDCHESASRHYLLRRVTRSLLAPFVEFPVDER